MAALAGAEPALSPAWALLPPHPARRPAAQQRNDAPKLAVRELRRPSASAGWPGRPLANVAAVIAGVRVSAGLARRRGRFQRHRLQGSSRRACPKLPNNLSPSAISTFQECPKLFEFRYVQRLPSATSPELERGTVVHAVLEDLFRLPSEERTEDAALRFAKSRIQDSAANLDLCFTSDEQRKTQAEDWIRDVVHAVRHYFDIENPQEQFEKQYIERQVTANLPGAEGHLSTLMGYLDRVDLQRDAQSGELVLTIVDYKTGLAMSEHWQQLLIYALALALGTTLQWDRVQGRLLYLGEKPVVQVKDFTSAEIERIHQLVLQVRSDIIQAADTGFVPKPSQRCDRCSFKSKCPAFRALGSTLLSAVVDVKVPEPLALTNGTHAPAPLLNAGPRNQSKLTRAATGPRRIEKAASGELGRRGPGGEQARRQSGRPGVELREEVAATMPDLSGAPELAEEEPARDAPRAPAAGHGRGCAAGAGITVVSTAEEAARVSEILLGLREAGRVHAVDTETLDWGPGQSPYNHGWIVCFSVFCGEDVDFGSGPRLWVDNMGEGGEPGTLVQCFREYLEDPGVKKVFHNYSFDRAMFKNMGITVAGFAGDTMHMARLWDTELPEYSLRALSELLLEDPWRKSFGCSDLFGKAGVKNFADVLTNSVTRDQGIEYSTRDTVATWKLHEHLTTELRRVPWEDCLRGIEEGKTMLDFYLTFWRPFAEVLVAMECRGMYVNTAHLQAHEVRAQQDIEKTTAQFRGWLRGVYAERWPEETALVNGIEQFNFSSFQQMIQLLFTNEDEERTINGVRIRGLGLPRTLVPGVTKSGAMSLAGTTLEELAGPQPSEGEAGCGTAVQWLGVDGCRALSSLCKVKKIKKTLNTFLQPLQTHVDAASRIHAQFNLNTSTGRLSCQSPNLQQQPALEKDDYEIRKAFACPPGQCLIVADYAQLELRVLAHLTKCPSLIQALVSDGDIHSRTAAQMYDHVRAAVEAGDVLLEGGDGSKPTVKEAFASERRRAKTLNFGIIYGMQAQGLSKGLGCSRLEAQATIDRWYEGRPGVLRWKEESLRAAVASWPPAVKSLRGRRRALRDLRNANTYLRSSAERQAINAPCQGGAVDIVVEAMLSLEGCPELRDLGFQLVLQVHDELVLEGPRDRAEEALALVRGIMEKPFVDGSTLCVPLPVDAHVVQCWGDAKG